MTQETQRGLGFPLRSSPIIIQYFVPFNIHDIIITPLPAHHTPGSCMFVCELDNKLVCYTGDFRYDNVIKQAPWERWRTYNHRILLYDNSMQGIDHVPTYKQSYLHFCRWLDKHQPAYLVEGCEILENMLAQDHKQITIVRRHASVRGHKIHVSTVWHLCEGKLSFKPYATADGWRMYFSTHPSKKEIKQLMRLMKPTEHMGCFKSIKEHACGGY
jgi:hypothetical protein